MRSHGQLRLYIRKHCLEIDRFQSVKILVVCNNHNSLALLDLSQRMAGDRPDLEVVVVCEERLSAAVASKLKGFPRSKVEIWTVGVGQRVDSDVASRLSEPKKWSPLSLLKTWASTNTGNEPRRSLGALLKASTPVQLFAECYIAMRLERAKRQALEIIDREKPTAVFSISDRSHDYLESALLWSARLRRVKVVLPYVAHYDKEYAIGYRKDGQGRLQKEFNPFSPFNLYKIWSFFRFRRQLYKGAFFQAPCLLGAHRRAGTLSSYPWWPGNGLSDIVCVNSRHTHDVFLKNHVPQEKLRLVGDVYYDVIVEQYTKKDTVKSEYMSRYGFDPEKKMVVVAMPQFAEQGLLGEVAHWESINGLMGELVKTGCNILVSLHPRMDPKKYSYIEEKFQCRIAQERLAEFLVLADVFVAHLSSTVVWAVLCGIPVVVLDHLSLNKNFYDYLKTVNVVRDISLIGNAVLEACRSEMMSFKNDWRELSKLEVFDGKTIDRYIKILEIAD